MDPPGGEGNCCHISWHTLLALLLGRPRRLPCDDVIATLLAFRGAAVAPFMPASSRFVISGVLADDARRSGPMTLGPAS